MLYEPPACDPYAHLNRPNFLASVRVALRATAQFQCWRKWDSNSSIPLLRNYLLCAAAGVTWYLQFFFYTMGETKMGRYGFASWTLHMASIIIFSTMWGWIFHEWKGSSKKAHSLIAGGIVMLIISTIVIGVGTWLKTKVGG